MSKFYQAAFFLAKIVLSLVIFLFIVSGGFEIYLRSVSYLSSQPPSYPCMRSDRELNHLFRENCKESITGKLLKTDYDVEVRTNEFGLRMEKIRQTARKIAVIGDSYTEGFGLQNNESFPSVLEKELKHHSNKDFQVLNGGTVGFSPALYPLYYLKKIQPLRPEMVLLNLDFSDLNETIYYTEQADFDANGRPIAFPGRDIFPASIAGLVYSGKLASLRFIHSEVNAWARWRRAQSAKKIMDAMVADGVPLVSKNELESYGIARCWKPYELLARYISDLKLKVEADGAKFAIHVYPPGAAIKSRSPLKQSISFWQMYERGLKKADDWNCFMNEKGIEVFNSLAKQWRVPFFNSFPVVMSHPKKEALYFDIDHHWNKDGVEVVVNSLAVPILQYLEKPRMVR